MAIASTNPRESGATAPAWRAYGPGAAGAAYVLAWAVGLSVWPVNLALNATNAQVTSSYRAHPAAVTTQYLLVEGLAGLLLGVVLGSVLYAVRDRTGRFTAGPAVFGAIAVLTSLSQCVVGLLANSAAAANNIASCGALNDALNRLDGVKMLAIVGATAWIAVLGPTLPRWLRAVTILLGLSLIASGCAYIALFNGLAWTAFVSGTLLLIWVAGAGIARTVSARRAG